MKRALVVSIMAVVMAVVLGSGVAYATPNAPTNPQLNAAMTQFTWNSPVGGTTVTELRVDIIKDDTVLYFERNFNLGNETTTTCEVPVPNGPGTYLYRVVVWDDDFFSGPSVATLTVVVVPDPPVTLTPVYRFYNKKNGSHFYTASATERDDVLARLFAIYDLDGPAYNLSSAFGTTLHRFYNKKNGSHFYTADPEEKQRVQDRLSSIYVYDGPAYKVSATQTIGTVPVYRFYNKKNGSHFYTASATEKADVETRLSATYQLDGIAFYVIP